MTTKAIILSFFWVLAFRELRAQQELLIQQALDYSYREQWDSAISCYNRMPEKSVNYYFDRGMCYMLNTQFNEALKDFIAQTELHPNESDGWLMLAECALYTENFQLAEFASRTFSKLEGKNSAAKFIFACALLYQNKASKAKCYFKIANRLDPNAILPKTYLSKVFNKSFKMLQWPSCLESLNQGFGLVYPCNSYEEKVFSWHCIHISKKSQVK